MNLLLSLHPVDKERVPRARDSLRSLALGLERGRGLAYFFPFIIRRGLC